MPQIFELFKKCNTITKFLTKASRLNTALQVIQHMDASITKADGV